MKILIGKYRNHRLKLAKKLLFEPISTRIRTNIFNVLKNYNVIYEKNVLDLFSGSGILGWEAWSQGAKKVFFNDNNLFVIDYLKINSLKFIHDQNDIFCQDYSQTLSFFHLHKIKFDLIFLDPPFKNSVQFKNSLKLIYQYHLLNDHGIIVVRTLESSLCELNFVKIIQYKKYGRHFIYFCQMQTKNSSQLILNNSLLVILSGPSGVGKSKIIKTILQDEKLNLALSVSITTRKQRLNDKNGSDYFFISQQQFQKEIEQNNFLEYAKFVEQYYGTSKQYVQNLINQNKNIVFEIEIEGAIQIKKQFPKAIWIFIFPPSMDELKNRIQKRDAENEEEIKKRLFKAQEEIKIMQTQQLADYDLFNEDFNQTVLSIKNIIKKNLKHHGI